MDRVAGANFASNRTGFVLPDDVVQERLGKQQRRGQPPEDWFATKTQLLEYLFQPEGEPLVTLQRAPDLDQAKELARDLCRSSELQDTKCPPTGNELFPEEWIQVLAYRIYEHRGRSHGRDREDWFAAKVQLYERFAPLLLHEQWTRAFWTTFVNQPLDDALLCTAQFSVPADMGCPASESPIMPSHPRKDSKMQRKIKKLSVADPDDFELARANKDPLSLVSSADKKRFRGQKIAVLLDSDPKLAGKVIAHSERRDDVRSKVAALMEYSGKAWALCEVPRE